MKTTFLFLISVTLLLTAKYSYSQMSIDAKACTNGNSPSDTVEVCIGDSIYLSAIDLSFNFAIFDFNNSDIGNGWTTNSILLWSNPCAPTTLPADSIVCWIGSNPHPRELVTNSINTNFWNYCIEWDMKYGANQNSSNCESPDLPNEGIHLQYSIDSGSTWIQFPSVDQAPSGIYGDTNYTNGSGGYWTPVSSNAATGPYYTWNHYKNAIPAAALYANTKIRWYQDLASGNSFDHWGIDNVQISHPTQPYLEWRCIERPAWHSYDFNPVAFIGDTLGTYHYIASIMDLMGGGGGASDTVVVNVVSLPSTPTIVNNGDTLYSSSNTGNQWYLDGNLITGAVDNYHIATANGDYQVIISPFGCASDTSNTVTLNGVGVKEIASNKEFLLQPNPANEYFSIQTNERITQLQIFSMSGKLVELFIQPNRENNYNIKNLTKGLFFVKIYTEKRVSIQKLIKL